MRIEPDLYYRRYGVRRVQQLTSPRLIPVTSITLPFYAIYHYRPSDSVVYGPDQRDPFFQDMEGNLFIEHVTELQSEVGSPRANVFNADARIRDYRRLNREFRPLRNDTTLHIQKNNVLVVNYALLQHAYRYIQSYKRPFFQWANVSSTIWKKINEVHQRFEGFEQFIDLKIPPYIPTLKEMNLMSDNPSQKAMGIFKDPDTLNLWDLWMWFSEEREKSTISHLSNDALAHVNIIVRFADRFFVMNLGLLDSWRKDDQDGSSDGVLKGEVMQKRFIRLLHGMRDLLTGATELGGDDDDEDQGSDSSKKNTTKKKDNKSDDLDRPIELPAPVTDEDKPTKLSLDDLRKELNTLQSETLPDDLKETNTSIDQSNDPYSQDIIDRAWTLHENGRLSAAAYKKIVKDAQAYRQLKNPFDPDKPFSDLLTVTEDDVALPDIPQVPDRDTIPDKSMLQSKINAMHRKYTTDVLKKDVTRSVMSLQKQGVVVKDYKVERTEDALNRYEEHTITVKPTNGRQSTVRFRLPVVDDFGRFVSNGNVSRLRLQRVDIPIRKVNPSRVALTSYYNKTFVDRSTRVINNLEKWIGKEIVQIFNDPDDDRITNVKLSNVFDQSYEVPRIYSLLAKRFVRLTIQQQYHLYLNYPHRQETLFEEQGFDVDAVEKKTTMTVIGFHRKGKVSTPIVVDQNNTFYLADDETTVLGTIYDLTGLSQGSAPVEVIEVSVANKKVPIGILLGYHYGLKELLSRLNIEYTTHPSGERTSLTENDYALRFEDEILVVSKLDTKSLSILAGFNRFHKSIKEYSIYDFDRRDVYGRILADAGLGARYLREMDTLFKMWVDPITEGILKEMGEPTEFDGLLFRAVELLQTDQSPEETDGAYMRYRGYERMAGMVYNELARAVKMAQVKPGAQKGVIDVNPHAVWQRFIQDSSVILVEEANPISALREQEAFTFRGEGGRGAKSMVERTRKYHESDVGVVSEATVDSGDVASVAYLSPDPNFNSLRGTTRRIQEGDGAAKYFSSAALLSPAVEYDDCNSLYLLSVSNTVHLLSNQ